MEDRYGREIDYLRISVTDKCNLRCRYCMPKDIDAVPMFEILTFEEIREVVSAAAYLGIKKIKVTGGEPLVRRNICGLVDMLKSVEGIEQVTLTTNGILLSEYIDGLGKAGIDGINISLDTLDREKYKEITGFDEFDRVKEGISTVIDRGIPLKLNAVSLNRDDVFSLIEYVRDRAIDVRFIELMPIGAGRDHGGITHDILIPEVFEHYKGMARDESKHGNGPAVYYRIPGYKGSVGFISALHESFCDKCNRIRLTTMGFLKNCLCYDTGADLKKVLRSGLTEEERRQKLILDIKEAILCKPESHCFVTKEDISEKHPMSQIGG